MPSTLVSTFKLFVHGLMIPFRALGFIFDKPDLLTLSLAPILSAIILFSLMIYALMAGLWGFVHSSVLAAVSAYSGIIFFLALILILGALSFFVVSLLTFLMTLLSSPFNDVLAEKTELALAVTDVPHWSIGRFIRVFWIDFRKTIVTLFTGLVFSLGMLVPVANIFFFLGLALLNTFTFITYPQSRREQGLLASAAWIRDHFFLSLGFGITTVVLFSIPVIDIFALPLSVVGGTLLFIETKKS